MTEPASSMSRFGSVRRRYIWSIVKQGPSKIGYAYFRARRRKRNIPDDQTPLSESDQVALAGKFDATDALLEGTAVGSRLTSERAFEPGTVTWLLPFFYHVYFGGTRTLLRFADDFARVHSVANHFHCHDVGPRPVAATKAKVRQAFPALSEATFTSAALRPEQLPRERRQDATLWSRRLFVVAHAPRSDDALLRPGPRAARLRGRLGLGAG